MRKELIAALLVGLVLVVSACSAPSQQVKNDSVDDGSGDVVGGSSSDMVQDGTQDTVDAGNQTDDVNLSDMDEVEKDLKEVTW